MKFHKKHLKNTKQIEKTKIQAQIEKTKQAIVRALTLLNFHDVKDIEQIDKIREQVVNALEFRKKQIKVEIANAEHAQIKKTKQSSDALSSFKQGIDTVQIEKTKQALIALNFHKKQINGDIAKAKQAQIEKSKQAMRAIKFHKNM